MVSRYVTLINIIFISLIGFLALEIQEVWKEKPAEVQAAVRRAGEKPVAPPAVRNRHHPRRFYQPIIDKDLFRPERTEWEPPRQETETPQQQDGSAPEPPEVIVYGIVISDDLKLALLKVSDVAESNRRRRSPTRSKEKEELTKVEEGDQVEGWLVEAIEPDTVFLARNNETLAFHLIEPGKPKPRFVPPTAIRQPPKTSSARKPVSRPPTRKYTPRPTRPRPPTRRR